MLLFIVRVYLAGWAFILLAVGMAFLLRGWVDKQLEGFFEDWHR